MPGPVSQSYPGPRDPPKKLVRDNWRDHLKHMGFHFFILDIEDVFEALTPTEAITLGRLMEKYNLHRDNKQKPRRSYWVARRDYKCGPHVKKLIEAELCITLKG